MTEDDGDVLTGATPHFPKVFVLHLQGTDRKCEQIIKWV